MKKFEFTITDSVGIHARPAGLLTKEASKYESKITISKGNKSADLKRILALMGMAVKCGETITIEAEGADEDKAVAELEAFFKKNI